MALHDNPFSVSNVYDFSLSQLDINSSVSAMYEPKQQPTFMAFHDNPFSVSNSCDFSLSAMYGHLHSSDSAMVYSPLDSSVLASKVYHDFSLSAMYEYPNRISDLFFSPGFLSREDLFNFMTNEDDVFSFEYMISESDKEELQRLASLLMSDSDYFFTIVGTKFGSKRVMKLLGKSDDVDALICNAIVDRFLEIMTDKYASQVALRALTVFDKKKKTTMYELILLHALDIAYDKHGCVALNDIITYADPEDEYYRDSILEFVAHNALFLSDDDSGKHVVEHVLKLNDLPYTLKIMYNLSGRRQMSRGWLWWQLSSF